MEWYFSFLVMMNDAEPLPHPQAAGFHLGDVLFQPSPEKGRPEYQRKPINCVKYFKLCMLI